MLTYLACPYSHPDPGIRQTRFRLVTRVAGILMSRGEHVFSPITHNHPIVEVTDLPRDWNFWRKYDEIFLAVCSKLCVLTLQGWQTSIGVSSERKFALEREIPIEYINTEGEVIHV